MPSLMSYATTTATSKQPLLMENAIQSPGVERTLSVCVVEDNAQYRDSIENLIEATPNMNLSGSFPHCEALLRKTTKFDEKTIPDVILLDICFKRTGKRHRKTGIEGIPEIKLKLPEVPILMLTDYDAADYIFTALQRGASGYLHKSSDIQDIIYAIRMADRGGMVIPPAVASKVLQLFQGVDLSSEQALSKREMEVVELMAKGRSRKEIAELLFISPNTVDSHLNKIYQKLHVSTGNEAIAKIFGARSPLSS